MLDKSAFQFEMPAAAPGPAAPTKLIVPKDGPRVAPRRPEQVNAYVRAEFDKAMETWGIHNNLARTMGCHPLLALTEVDYANSFIFQKNVFVDIPRPGKETSGETVLFPAAGFIDSVTKELMITLVSLKNRSRYSITHHAVISYSTLCNLVAGGSPAARAKRAEALLLHVTDGQGRSTYEGAEFQGNPLYSDLQIAVLKLAERANANVHRVTEEQFNELRGLLRDEARRQIAAGPLAVQFGQKGPDAAYLDAYVDGMLVEFTWCLVHFSGLLNRWFTLLKVKDEEFAVNDHGQNFIDVYNAVVPESIRIRNNALLGSSGWGST
jgi:hypothetical protein